jgi:hypothetical protein
MFSDMSAKSRSDWNQLVASAEKRSFCCDTINNNRKPRTRRVEEAASTTVHRTTHCANVNVDLLGM